MSPRFYKVLARVGNFELEFVPILDFDWNAFTTSTTAWLDDGRIDMTWDVNKTLSANYQYTQPFAVASTRAD